MSGRDSRLFSDVKEDISNLLKTRASNKRQVDSKISEMKELERRIRDATSDLQLRLSDVSPFIKEYERICRDHSSAEFEFKSVCTGIQLLETEVKGLIARTASVENAERDISNSYNDFRTQHEPYVNHSANLADELSRLQPCLKVLINKRTTYKSNVQLMESDKKSRKEELNAIEASLSTFQHQLKEKKNLLTKLNEEKQLQDASIFALNARLKELQDTLETEPKGNRLSALELKRQEIELEINNLESDLQVLRLKLDQEVSELSSKLKDEESNVVFLENDILQDERKKEEIEEYNKSINEKIKLMDEKREELEKQLRENREQLLRTAKDTIEAEAVAESLSNSINLIEKQLESMRHERNDCIAMLENGKLTFELILSKIFEEEGKHCDMQRQVNNTQEREHLFREKIQFLQQSISSMESQHTELQNTSSFLMNNSMRQEQEDARVDTEINDLIKKKEGLERSLNEINNRESMIKIKLAELNESCKEVQTTLSASNNCNTEFVNTLRILSNEEEFIRGIIGLEDIQFARWVVSDEGRKMISSLDCVIDL